MLGPGGSISERRLGQFLSGAITNNSRAPSNPADSGGSDATIGNDSGSLGADSGLFFGQESGSPDDSGRSTVDSGSSCMSCAAGQTCSNGVCVCPAYETLCNGGCIPTSGDPNNCGGCGLKCTGSQVCSANACSSGCLSGLIPCAGACIDPNGDSENCGSCANKYASGTGCAGGKCVPAAALNADAGAAHCTGGGTPSTSA